MFNLQLELFTCRWFELYVAVKYMLQINNIFSENENIRTFLNPTKMTQHSSWQSLKGMLLLVSKLNQTDRTEDLMGTLKSKIENALPFCDWPCYPDTFGSVLSSLIYALPKQIKFLLFCPFLDWCSVKGEHHQPRKTSLLSLVWHLSNEELRIDFCHFTGS